MFAIDFVTSLYRQISGCYKYYIMKLPAILFEYYGIQRTTDIMFTFENIEVFSFKRSRHNLTQTRLHLRTSEDCVYNGCLLIYVILI